MPKQCTTPERFWTKVEFTDTCWLWTGAKTNKGYGNFAVESERKWVGAHRYAYEFCVGPIPGGLHIDHLCRVPLCVLPEHLEPVTVRENLRRGINGILTTHCPQGHAYDEANTRWRKHRTASRACRACDRGKKREQRTNALASRS